MRGLLAALLHPIRWTRLFFRAILGELPMGSGTQTTGGVWSLEDREDEGYDA